MDMTSLSYGPGRDKTSPYICFLSSADFFSKSIFLKNSFRNTIRVSNSFDVNHAGCFVGPDLGPNCMQRLPADNTSR